MLARRAWRWSAIFASSLACFTGFLGLSEAPAASAERMASSVVEIIRSGGSLGAGVQVEKGLILTAAHLVSNDATVTVRDDQGREQVGTVLVRDTALDVALVAISSSLMVAVSPLSCEVPPIGLPVRMIGHPLGRTFISMRGFVVSGLRSLNPWSTLGLREPACAVISGNGQVVGLVVASTQRGRRTGPAGAVPGSALCAFLPRPDTYGQQEAG